MKIIASLETCTTQRSLQTLRNALAGSINNQIRLLEVQTNDHLTSYLILDLTQDTATWTGDGFRLDLGGEGGAGYNTARILLRIFGCRPAALANLLDLQSLANTGFDEDAQEIALEALIRDFIISNQDEISLVPSITLGDLIPNYVRV